MQDGERGAAHGPARTPLQLIVETHSSTLNHIHRFHFLAQIEKLGFFT